VLIVHVLHCIDIGIIAMPHYSGVMAGTCGCTTPARASCLVGFAPLSGPLVIGDPSLKLYEQLVFGCLDPRQSPYRPSRAEDVDPDRCGRKSS